MHKDYCGIPIFYDVDTIDTELVSYVITNLKCGKAAGRAFVVLSAALSVVLAKLCQLMMICSYVPDGFRYSYSTATEAKGMFQ